MNERIFKLSLQAMDFHGAIDTDTELKLTNNELEKFAELIVRECAEVGLDSVEDGDNIDAIMRRVHNNILKHFGVEA